MAGDELTQDELKVWARGNEILNLVGGWPPRVCDSGEPQSNATGQRNVEIGGWYYLPEADFADVLLHEAAHAESGASDHSQAFEAQLSQWLDIIAVNSINGKQ